MIKDRAALESIARETYTKFLDAEARDGWRNPDVIEALLAQALKSVQDEAVNARLSDHEKIQAMMNEFFARNGRNPNAWETIYWLRANVEVK